MRKIKKQFCKKCGCRLYDVEAKNPGVDFSTTNGGLACVDCQEEHKVKKKACAICGEKIPDHRSMSLAFTCKRCNDGPTIPKWLLPMFKLFDLLILAFKKRIEKPMKPHLTKDDEPKVIALAVDIGKKVKEISQIVGCSFTDAHQIFEAAAQAIQLKKVVAYYNSIGRPETVAPQAHFPDYLPEDFDEEFPIENNN